MPKQTDQTDRIVVKNVRFAPRVISVSWFYREEPLELQSSNLYLHIDGTLHIDGETAKLGTEFGTEFLQKVFHHPDWKKAKKKKVKVSGPTEYGRIESILRKDEMYKRELRRKARGAVAPGVPSPISVWKA